jgi:hypothetical protein
LLNNNLLGADGQVAVFLYHNRTGGRCAGLAVRLDINIIFQLLFSNGLESHRDETTRGCGLKVDATKNVNNDFYI